MCDTTVLKEHVNVRLWCTASGRGPPHKLSSVNRKNPHKLRSPKIRGVTLTSQWKKTCKYLSRVHNVPPQYGSSNFKAQGAEWGDPLFMQHPARARIYWENLRVPVTFKVSGSGNPGKSQTNLKSKLVQTNLLCNIT